MLKRVFIFILLFKVLLLANSSPEETLLEFLRDYATKIDIKNNPSQLPYTITISELKSENFDKVYRVYLSGENLSYLPKEITLLANLGDLEIDICNMKELPSEIKYLINLDTLEINNCNMEKLSSEIGDLINLHWLSIKDNKLETLPPEVSKLQNLRVLNLSNNQLNKFPEVLFDLNLSALALANNNIKSIPIKIETITTLKSLDVSFNQLKSIPKEIANLSLVRLSLNDNQIEELPKELFDTFEEFTYILNECDPITPPYYYGLDISNNRLSYIPREVCGVYGFEDLRFHGNYFDKIPECISDLRDSCFGKFSFNTTSPYGEFGNSEDIIFKWEFAPFTSIGYSQKDDKTFEFKTIISDRYYIPDSYSWNFGDGNSSILELPTYTYSNYGDYNVTLTLNSGEYSTSKIISVYPRVLELKKGWNMITPPTKDDINASIFETVWSYQNETWENNHSCLIPTIGYWVKLSEDLNYSYSGEVYELPNYKIKSGWNFVGSGENWFRESNQTIYQYKNSEWLINPNEIKRGYGFWVKK